MKVLTITAGAANMYCGSCLRDNSLATELLRLGHDVTLVPIYTPTRTDEPNVSESRVLYGGLNVYLQQHLSLFRHTPAFIDRLFDSGWIMTLLSKLSVSTDPADLGSLTVSTLKGENGYQRKEVAKLTEWLREHVRPDVVVLPNSLMIGLAGPLRRALGVPVACTLQGEDLFLNGLREPHRREAIDLIRRQVDDVDIFLPVSDYYADFMGGLLGIPATRMSVVPLGINLEGYRTELPVRQAEDPIRIGYFARVAPEKGLHNLVSAYIELRRSSGLPAMRLEVAGYLGREHRGYLDRLRDEMHRAGLGEEFAYRGVVDRTGKIDFLQSLDIVSVPTDYDEPKGLFLLESMAAGVPVVQPNRGAFPEMLGRTQGGLLVEPGDVRALADGLATLVTDSDLRRRLGRQAAEGVRAHYTVESMARSALSVFESLSAGEPLEVPQTVQVGAS